VVRGQGTRYCREVSLPEVIVNLMVGSIVVAVLVIVVSCVFAWWMWK
jgi:hypothetical protein